MEQIYNAPVAKVFSLLTDAKWLKARSIALGDLSVHIKTKTIGKGTTVTTKRSMHGEPAVHLTEATAPRIDLVFLERWNPEFEGVRTGKLTMSAVDQHIKMSANFELVPSGNHCIYRIVHKYKCNVPLIGDAIHKFAQAQIEETCADEFAYLVGYLAGTIRPIERCELPRQRRFVRTHAIESVAS